MNVQRWTLGVLCLLLTGCFSRETSLKVYPDGTGTLTIRTTLTPEGVQYLQGLTRSKSLEKGFTESGLMSAASQFGEGVTYHSHHSAALKTGGLLLEVVYQVNDVNRLRISLDPGLPLLGDPLSPAKAPGYPPYRFRQRKNGPLTIYPPPVNVQTPPVRVKVEAGTVEQQRQKRFERERAQWLRFGNPFRLTGDETQLELVQRLAEGMRFRFEVETANPIRSTNSPYRIGDQRILLYAVQASELLKDPDIQHRIKQGTLSNLNWSELALSEQVVVDKAEYRLLDQQAP